jgi:hypothetical protein
LGAAGGRVWAIVVAVMVVAASAEAGAYPQAGTTANDIRIVSLLQPGDTGFAATLDSEFPGLKDVADFPPVAPLVVILHNESRHGLLAYSIQWTVTHTDGSVSTEFHEVIQEPDDKWTLSGQRVILLPGDTQLVSPSFHWSASQFRTLLRLQAVSLSLDAGLPRHLGDDFGNASKIHAALDGVVFDDGVFIGPDTGRLYERFQAEQRGELEEGAWLEQQFAIGKDTLEITPWLKAQIKKAEALTGSEKTALYNAARGREASRFLGILEDSGEAALEAEAKRVAGSKPIALRRQPGS